MEGQGKHCVKWRTTALEIFLDTDPGSYIIQPRLLKEQAGLLASNNSIFAIQKVRKRIRSYEY